MTALYDADVSMFTGEIHPFAARFPMLSDDDLDALAADIKANGLINPIVLDEDGMLVDGRNRLAACERAGVRPVFDMLPIPDPVAFIVSANMQRRDLPAAQKAHLVVAAGLLESNSQTEAAAVAGVSQGLLAQAAVVAKYSPQDHNACCDGAPHDPAYQRAKQIKADLQQQAAQIADIRTHAPDIAQSGLPLEEQWAAYERRTREAREAETKQNIWRKKLRDSAVAAVLETASAAHPNNFDDLVAGLRADPSSHVTPAYLLNAADQLTQLAARLKEKK